MTAEKQQLITAGVLVIGDEILSGRTKDTNSGYIADFLTTIGIDLKEIRVVSDDMDEIISAVNVLREKYTYIFTTGGIGPTHDDITADAVSAAFQVPLNIDERAVALLKTRISDDRLNEARLRMARIPEGADIIHNPVSAAPGFRIGNVHVMAGVPSVMKAMMDEIAPTLKTGAKMISESIPVDMGEGTIAAGLGEIQSDYPDVLIGSYPTSRDGKFVTTVVLRSRDELRLAEAVARVNTLVARLS